MKHILNYYLDDPERFGRITFFILAGLALLFSFFLIPVAIFFVIIILAIYGYAFIEHTTGRKTYLEVITLFRDTLKEELGI